jgi:hypothetical protein
MGWDVLEKANVVRGGKVIPYGSTPPAAERDPVSSNGTTGSISEIVVRRKGAGE